MKAKIIIYQKPTCTTCRQTMAILREAGIDFDSIDYYLEPIGKTRLKKLLTKMNMNPSAMLRKRESIYKQLGLEDKKLKEDQILDLLVSHPDLLQRPIVEKGNKAILARPAEKIREIL